MIRQNHVQDRALVEAARADVAFVQSDLMVHECLQLLKTPTLGRFIARPARCRPRVAAATLQRVRDEVGEGAPSAWTFECDIMQAGNVRRVLPESLPGAFRIADLLPTRPTRRCACAPRR